MACRKLPDKFEEPLSIYAYPYVEQTADLLHNYLSPNQMTILNMLFRVYILHLFDQGKYKQVGIYLIFTTFIDFVDGCTARKYDMVTEIGDYLDHGSDLIFYAILFYKIYTKLKDGYKKIFIILTVLFSALFVIYMSCQEKYFNNDTPITLYYIQDLCVDKSIMSYTKYFGLFGYTIHMIIETFFIE
jgi:phosphatidylglycerophosphate synthase